MGSLFSKPSLPSPVVYSAPASTPTTNAATAVVTANNSGVQDTEKVVTTIQKKRSLPQTIQTSFRGVLEQADFVPQRKSLLGE